MPGDLNFVAPYAYQTPDDPYKVACGFFSQRDAWLEQQFPQYRRA